MNRNRNLWPFAALIFSLVGLSQTSGVELVTKVADYEKSNSQLLTTLEALTDWLGPRLTGSENLRKANQWTADRMKEWGLRNVRLEEWTLPTGWERGPLIARLISPVRRDISAAAMAWTPNCKIRGPLVLFNPKDQGDWQRWHGKLKNAIVLPAAPAKVDMHPSRQRPTGMEEEQIQDQARNAFLEKEGAAVILRDAGKPHMLLNMTGSWSRGRAKMTTLFVTNDHYSMLYRMCQKNEPLTMEVENRSKFIKGPVKAYNTVGEIVGAEKPDEVVICGGHLDSWDLGTGATDNGTGSSVTLEAARVIQALGLKPKRTIRFILFSGEEQGLVGSREYVKAHRAEMAKVSAVFIHDTGTGKVTKLGLSGNRQLTTIFDELFAPLKSLGWDGYFPGSMGGTDHASFTPQGVPGFWFVQDGADYGLTHHSQSDTFDKAIEEDLKQGATVMACMAMLVADYPTLLPRRNDGGE